VSRKPEFTQEDIAEHWAIRDGLKAQAARREQGDALVRAARRQAGELTRRAEDLKARCPQLRIDITEAAQITGLSRPTLYAAAREQPADPEGRDYQGMTDAAVATAALQGYDDARAELHARFPGVAALREAAAYLTVLHWGGRPGVRDWLDAAPGSAPLGALYDAHVKAIAAGKPVNGIDTLILTREDA